MASGTIAWAGFAGTPAAMGSIYWSTLSAPNSITSVSYIVLHACVIVHVAVHETVHVTVYRKIQGSKLTLVHLKSLVVNVEHLAGRVV